jgi:hypothetical protein
MTKLYNELGKKMVSRENTEIVKNLYVTLYDRFEHFKTAHMECLDICADLDIVETLEMNFDSCKKNLMEFPFFRATTLVFHSFSSADVPLSI